MTASLGAVHIVSTRLVSLSTSSAYVLCSVNAIENRKRIGDGQCSLIDGCGIQGILLITGLVSLQRFGRRVLVLELRPNPSDISHRGSDVFILPDNRFA